jgi:ribosome-associated heat shock protein Hsp15
LDRQRIDKWLWHARVVRTRSAAAALVTSGHVRVNGARVTSPGRVMRIEDVVTVALDRSVRVMKVAAFAERRGAPVDARLLYADLTVQDGAPAQAIQSAAPFAGRRPGKHERRAIARLHGRDD